MRARPSPFSVSVLSASVLALAVASCAGTVRAPASISPCATLPASPRAHALGPLRAGVAEVDITPAPGLSLLGHGPEGRVSKGTLLRLRCQAFVFSQTVGDVAGEHDEAIAFVPCDLSWPSLVLSRRVAALLVSPEAPGTPVVPIGPDRLVLSATHTHASPAHYLGAANYAGLLSTERPGYSEDVVAKLSSDIARGVREAWKRRTEACVAWSKASFRDQDPATGVDRGPWVLASRFAKNRSMDAFQHDVLDDEERRRFLDPVALDEARAPGDHPARPALWAVDGTISVLRIDRCAGGTVAEGASLGAFSVVGVHPTAISNLNELYHGDLFGYATREAAARIAERHGAAPIVGIANGVEGDVSPIIDYQGTREARRLGGVLAKEIVALWEDAGTRLHADGILKSAYREVVPSGARVTAKNAFYDALPNLWGEGRTTATTCGEAVAGAAHPPPGCDPMLCEVARLGTAAAGGAKDGRTFFLDLPEMREGSISPSSVTCHAPKLELDPPGSDADAFPRRAPLHVVSIGGELVTTFPGEVTTVAGYRARRQLEGYLRRVRGAGERDAEHAADAEIVELGLTGEYLQYMATSDEYGAQQYEGASTLYGPNEARFVANQQLCLARWLFEEGMDAAQDRLCALDHTSLGEVGRFPQPGVGEVSEVVFHPGTKRSGAVSATCAAASRDCERERCFFDCTVPDQAARLSKVSVAGCGGNIYHVMRDGERGYGVRWAPPDGCGALSMQPRVRIIGEHGEVLDDDEGDGVEVRWVDGEWRIAWYPNERVVARVAKAAFRFEVGRSAGAWGERSTLADARCWQWP